MGILVEVTFGHEVGQSLLTEHRVLGGGTSQLVKLVVIEEG